MSAIARLAPPAPDGSAHSSVRRPVSYVFGAITAETEGLTLPVLEGIAVYAGRVAAQQSEISRAGGSSVEEIIIGSPVLVRHSLSEREADPLIAALSHGVEELQDSMGSINLSDYSRRILAALPTDPHQAIGAAKDMLEATMRTILHRRGEADVKKLDFPALTTRCMTVLGLAPTTPPATQGERYVRKIATLLEQ
jgi:hypothetical protein